MFSRLPDLCVFRHMDNLLWVDDLGWSVVRCGMRGMFWMFRELCIIRMWGLLIWLRDEFRWWVGNVLLTQVVSHCWVCAGNWSYILFRLMLGFGLEAVFCVKLGVCGLEFSD